MEREIDSVRDRCKECGGATCLIVREVEWDGSKWTVQAVYSEAVPHTRDDCRRLVTLTREQWPCLF